MKDRASSSSPDEASTTQRQPRDFTPSLRNGHRTTHTQQQRGPSPEAPWSTPRSSLDEAKPGRVKDSLFSSRSSDSDSEFSESTLESEWTERRSHSAASRAQPSRGSNGQYADRYTLTSPKLDGGAVELSDVDLARGPASEFSWVHRMSSKMTHNNALMDVVDEWGSEPSPRSDSEDESSTEEMEALFSQLADDTLMGVQGYLRSTTLNNIVDIVAQLLNPHAIARFGADGVVRQFLGTSQMEAARKRLGGGKGSATAKALRGLKWATPKHDSVKQIEVAGEPLEHDTTEFARVVVQPALAAAWGPPSPPLTAQSEKTTASPATNTAQSPTASPATNPLKEPAVAALCAAGQALVAEVMASNHRAEHAKDARAAEIGQLKHTDRKLVTIGGHMLASVRRSMHFNRGVCRSNSALLAAFPALCALAPKNRSASALVEANLIRWITALMIMHRQSARAQLVSLRLCTRLLCATYKMENESPSLTRCLLEVQQTLLPPVLSAMAIHPFDNAVQVAGCEAMLEFAKSKRNFPFVLHAMADKAALTLLGLLSRGGEVREVATHLIIVLCTLPSPPGADAFVQFFNIHHHWPTVREAWKAGPEDAGGGGKRPAKPSDHKVTELFAAKFPDQLAALAWKREEARKQRSTY